MGPVSEESDPFAGPTDPAITENVASKIGRTAAEVAALDRVFAGLREVGIARFGAGIAAESAARSMKNFCDAMQAADARLALDEAEQVAQHPDLAFLNAQMDGFYDA